MALWASFVRILPTNYGALLLQYVFKLDDRENIAGSGYLEPLAFCCIQPPPRGIARNAYCIAHSSQKGLGVVSVSVSSSTFHIHMPHKY